MATVHMRASAPEMSFKKKKSWIGVVAVGSCEILFSDSEHADWEHVLLCATTRRTSLQPIGTANEKSTTAYN